MDGLFDTADESAATPQAGAWQMGYSIETLRSLAAPFRAAKPFVFGAFGLTKERDVATALSENAFYTDSREAPTVAAIARQLKSASHKEDFRGVDVKIPAGDTVVWSLGATAEATPASFRLVLDACWPADGPGDMFGSSQWVEWFEEDNRRWILEGLGFEWVASRVSAGSEIKGLYVRSRGAARAGVQALQDADAAAIACLDATFLSLAMHEAIAAEVQAADWTQHYSSYNKGSSWTAFALRGFKPDDPGFIIKPAEMSAKWKTENAELLKARPDWTRIAPSFPATLQAVASVGTLLDRVRFMRLAATSGELTRHADITDREAGTADGKVARLHIPIITRPSCMVTSWGIRGQRYDRHFPEGSLCYLDQRRPHAVRNPEEVDRIHLVIDVRADAALRQRFEHATWRCDD